MTSTSRTFRPTGVIAVMWAVVVVLVVLIVAIGARLPQDYRFSTAQAATLWALIGVVAVLALACSLSKVTADEDGIVIVNAFRRRRFGWDEVAMISMRPGAPWPTMVTRDERRFILFAIQGSEGDSARSAVGWLVGHLR
ncbi:PH domain-containing protein [Aeromicrobium sp.]|uniref:PH domain-containing protein n=1 Tax=Aeromicrobium sp. TaxID=1871063 RepID=UPI0028A8F427|nr:PH domain-containing protein [Aeromicrobium sp.]